MKCPSCGCSYRIPEGDPPDAYMCPRCGGRYCKECGKWINGDEIDDYNDTDPWMCEECRDKEEPHADDS